MVWNSWGEMDVLRKLKFLQKANLLRSFVLYLVHSPSATALSDHPLPFPGVSPPQMNKLFDLYIEDDLSIYFIYRKKYKKKKKSFSKPLLTLPLGQSKTIFETLLKCLAKLSHDFTFTEVGVILFLNVCSPTLEIWPLCLCFLSKSICGLPGHTKWSHFLWPAEEELTKQLFRSRNRLTSYHIINWSSNGNPKLCLRLLSLPMLRHEVTEGNTKGGSKTIHGTTWHSSSVNNHALLWDKGWSVQTVGLLAGNPPQQTTQINSIYFFLPDVSCRKRLILARKKELSVLQLMFLFIRQVNLNCSFRLFFNFFCREAERRSKLTLLHNTLAAISLDIPPTP